MQYLWYCSAGFESEYMTGQANNSGVTSRHPYNSPGDIEDDYRYINRIPWLGICNQYWHITSLHCPGDPDAGMDFKASREPVRAE